MAFIEFRMMGSFVSIQIKDSHSSLPVPVVRAERILTYDTVLVSSASLFRPSALLVAAPVWKIPPSHSMEKWFMYLCTLYFTINDMYETD